jgi:putative YpdA family bacillithiol system oxidoreductase
LYIVGELGGIGLIKNAVTQATKAINHIVEKKVLDKKLNYDVVIVGAGPAGLTAALASQEHGLRYIVLEQGSIGGTIFHYPRQKLVLTAPVELPLYGKLNVSEISKEELLKMWMNVIESRKIRIQINTKVDGIAQNQEGFQVSYGNSQYTAKNVVLALGRRGSPRKLDVPGEDLPKVAYQLIEAEMYSQKNVLIVGGGDSAIEAAIALARQKGNSVTLSYRRSEFIRLKEKNEKNVTNLIQIKMISVIYNSQVLEIHRDSVLIKEESKQLHTISNDYIFIFAGGEMPIELLKRAGVRLRTEEIAH